jgi:hypothetical protein
MNVAISHTQSRERGLIHTVPRIFHYLWGQGSPVFTQVSFHTQEMQCPPVIITGLVDVPNPPGVANLVVSSINTVNVNVLS